MLAGGTDLLIRLRDGSLAPRVVVDVKRVPELAPGIRVEGGRLVIGATTAMTEIAAHPVIRRDVAALAESAAVVGSVQIRNRATLAGNLCNASPAADTAPALLVHGAEVVAVGPEGLRRIPLDGFFVRSGVTTLARGELVTAVELPIPGVASRERARAADPAARARPGVGHDGGRRGCHRRGPGGVRERRAAAPAAGRRVGDARGPGGARRRGRCGRWRRCSPTRRRPRPRCAPARRTGWRCSGSSRGGPGPRRWGGWPMADRIAIELVAQREAPRRRRGAAPHAARRAARRPRAHRGEVVLPRRGVRGLHGHRRRPRGRLVPGPRGRGRRRRRADGRGSRGGGRRAVDAPGRVPRARRRPVRLLHPGPADGGAGAARARPRTRRTPRSRRGSRATSAAARATSRSSRRCGRRRRRCGDGGARRRLPGPGRRHRPRHGRPAVRRGPAARGRAPREARHGGRAARPDPGRGRERGARAARCPPGAHRGRPAAAGPAVRAPEPGPARPRRRRDQVPRRPGGDRRRRHRRPGGGGRRGGPGRPRAAAGGVHDRGAPSRPTRRSSRTRRSAPAIHWRHTQRPQRARDRLGGPRAAERARRPRHRAPLHVPDGHPVRHRAPRVHGGARRRRRRRLERDPAPVLAPADARGRPRAAALEGPRRRAGPGRGVRRQAAPEVRAGPGVRGARGRPAGQARAEPRGDVPGGPPGGVRRDRRASASPATAPSASRTSAPTT